jgi:hypothetical protein
MSRNSYSFKKKREEIPLEDNSLHLNTIIEAIMTGKGIPPFANDQSHVASDEWCCVLSGIGGGLPPAVISPISLSVTSPGTQSRHPALSCHPQCLRACHACL